MNELLYDLSDPDVQLGLVLATAAIAIGVWLVMTEFRERRRPRCANCQRPNGDTISTRYGWICRHCSHAIGRWQRGAKPISPGVKARDWYGNTKPIQGFDGDGWRNG